MERRNPPTTLSWGSPAPRAIPGGRETGRVVCVGSSAVSAVLIRRPLGRQVVFPVPIDQTQEIQTRSSFKPLIRFLSLSDASR